jgi:hypothetical protein
MLLPWPRLQKEHYSKTGKIRGPCSSRLPSYSAALKDVGIGRYNDQSLAATFLQPNVVNLIRLKVVIVNLYDETFVAK